MDLVEQFHKAFDIYIKFAYPHGPNALALKVQDDLDHLDAGTQLDHWSALEHEGQKHFMRLGSESYPHMKLGFVEDAGHPLFFVDAHDSHFELPAHLPGADKLRALREKNALLKNQIETAMAAEGLPTFGFEKPKLRTQEKPNQLHVLIIDDEVKILDLMALILTKLGARVERATSVDQARHKIAESQPHLILCDIMMPDESGYAFVRWLKDQEYRIPTYFVTGLALDQVDRDGVVDVIQKPFSVNTLAQLISKWRKATA
ncbi:MAG: response regulator [Acidobacteria bacterium]|nr:response regulator [Acidobacteriota bacterium]MCB9397537.1 response regulator [Acidobacteriota bacterium]